MVRNIIEACLAVSPRILHTQKKCLVLKSLFSLDSSKTVYFSSILKKKYGRTFFYKLLFWVLKHKIGKRSLTKERKKIFEDEG